MYQLSPYSDINSIMRPIHVIGRPWLHSLAVYALSTTLFAVHDICEKAELNWY